MTKLTPYKPENVIQPGPAILTSWHDVKYYNGGYVLNLLAEAHAHYEAQVRPLGGLAQPTCDAAPEYSDAWLRARSAQACATLAAVHQAVAAPAGDAAMPVLAYRVDWHESAGVLLPKFFDADDRQHMDNLLRSLYAKDKYDSVVNMVDLIDAQAALAAAELRAANAEHDMIVRKNQDHATAARWDEHMRANADALAANDAELSGRRHVNLACIDRIAGLEADLAEERNRIADMRRERGEEVLDLMNRNQELNTALQTAINSNCDKIMAMSDEQVAALTRLDGSNPDDAARLARQAFELSQQKVRITDLESQLKMRLAYVDVLEADNFKLSAGQCANATGDDGGTPRCAEIAKLTAQARHAEDCLEAAKARIAELEADAGRYRWLRAWGDAAYVEWKHDSCHGTELDASIDSAMKKEPSIDAASLAPAAETFMHAVPEPRDADSLLAEHMATVDELVTLAANGENWVSMAAVVKKIDASAKRMLGIAS